MNRLEIEKQLVEKASQDPVFRQALVSDPRSAIERELGLKVPSSVDLKVIEESSNSLCLVLPAAQGELSDMELESVAGGKGEGPALFGSPRIRAGEEIARSRVNGWS